MRVALAQMKCSLGNIEANCSKIFSFAERAAEDHCRVVIYPEMSDTGYDTSVIRETASDWKGLPYSTLRRAAKDLGVYVICGLSERVGENLYNSIAALSPEGELIAKYRKTHLYCPVPVEEHKIFASGSSLATFQIEDMAWGLSICYDLRFPELYRSLFLKGAEVMVNCTAWPQSRSVHWRTLTRARAIENQAYMLGSGRVGTDGKSTFCGQSCIIKPYGQTAAIGSSDSEELVTADIDRNEVVSFREKIPISATRRPDIYGNLEKSDVV